jgi:hypothetical protein
LFWTLEVFACSIWRFNVDVCLAMRLENRKPLVLAVDDNLDNLLLVDYQLQTVLNCAVLTADCGAAAAIAAIFCRRAAMIICLNFHSVI